MISSSKDQETAKLEPQRMMGKFRSRLAASFSSIVHWSSAPEIQFFCIYGDFGRFRFAEFQKRVKIVWLNIKLKTNLIPRVVSEPLFQSSFQKTTLAQRVVFVGVFSDGKNTIRGPKLSLSLPFRHFVFLKDGKIFCHQLMLNFVRGEFRK